jgi:membrane protein implicated in regulation of membrane protease activity
MCHVLMVMPLLGLLLFVFLPWPLALALYLPIVGLSWLGYKKIVYALHQPPLTGIGAMIGKQAEVVGSGVYWINVRYQQEIWRAECGEALRPGQPVIIEGAEGLTLQVAPLR